METTTKHNESQIRVVIADDHQILLDSLSEHLNLAAGILVVGKAINGKEAYKLVQQHLPDIAILDIDMPVMDGLESAERIIQDCPTCKVLILSSTQTDKKIRTALELGVSGYLSKSAASKQLVQALHTIQLGGSIVDAAMMKRLMRRSEPSELAQLTARERKLLIPIAQGCSNQQIADQLFLAEVTVRSNVSRILAKLNMQNRVQLATFALREGVVTLAETSPEYVAATSQTKR